MSDHSSSYVPSNAVTRWLDERLPIIRLMYDSFIVFPTPRNLNYLWTFGGILTFCLVVQIITGIVLAMHFVAHGDHAFASVEHIMRDVNWGDLIRYTHAVGASMFFFAAYVHLFRGLYYGSYKSPREIIWIFGVVILLLMIITAFMGYSLVWGQMSFWAVTVITNLFTAIPFVGETITQWIWGGYSVGDPTLNRLFSLHYLFPFIIAALVGLHIWALHVVGSNNPTGVDVKTEKDTLSFFPFYVIKDGFAVVLFMLLFSWFVFYAPNYLGHSDNFIEANPLQTPPHIVPEWYFLPFYAILRAIPDKLLGVIAMVAAIVVLFVIPWLDTSKIRSVSNRPLFKPFFWLFVVTCLALGYLGSKNPEGYYLISSQLFTAYYFIFFLVIMPVVGLIETPKELPDSITEAVEGKSGKEGASS